MTRGERVLFDKKVGSRIVPNATFCAVAGVASGQTVYDIRLGSDHWKVEASKVKSITDARRERAKERKAMMGEPIWQGEALNKTKWAERLGISTGTLRKWLAEIKEFNL